MRTHSSDFHQRRFTRTISRFRPKSKPDKQKTLAGEHKESFAIEPLESRLLLSVTLAGSPDWTAQGPAPIQNGNNVILPAESRPQDAAVQAIAVDPTNANRVFIATVNGGVWRSTTATYSAVDGADNDGDGTVDEADETPTWTPLTDQLPSLSMGAVAFSPLDATNNTLFIGNGKFSSGFGDGQAQAGLFRTTDGGNTWTAIGGTAFNGQNIERILPTALGGSLASQVVLTAGGNGVMRSTDGGNTWTQISGALATSDGIDNDGDGTTDEAGERNLPSGYATDVRGDPTNNSRFYAAIPGQGVFRSDDGGATWRATNNGIAGIDPLGGRIELAVGSNGQAFAGLVNSSGVLTNVFSSTDQGANWAVLGTVPNTNPGGQGGTHFAIVADPTNAGVVYVAGDRGTANNAGNVFRYNPGTNAWVSLANGGASNTAPHPDTRDMAFDSNGNLLQANDGGLYRLRGPNSGSPIWNSVEGNLSATEFWSTAYDPFTNTIFGGTQDNGSPGQNSANNFTWTDGLGGDGGIVGIGLRDTNNDGTIDTTDHYIESQNMNSFRRIQFDAAHPGGLVINPTLTINGTGGNNTLNGTGTQRIGNPPAPTFDGTRQFVQPFVINNIDPTRILIGTSFLYESFDQGGSVNSLGGLSDLTNNGIDEDADGNAGLDPNEWAPAGAIGSITAMAYGGKLGGVGNADIAYVATNDGNLRLRTANTTNSMADFTVVAGYSGGAIRDIVLDPDNWQRGYVVDSNSRVFRFVNSGASAADWTNVTANLNPAAPGANPALSTDLRSIELYSATSTPGDEILLVGGSGGVFRTLDPFDGSNAVWTEFGSDLPNGLVSDLRYDATDDVLLVGMRGRGAWTISNASTSLTQENILQIDGDSVAGQDDTIRLVRDASNPSLLDVYVNSATPTATFQLSTIEQINVNGLGGNDTLIVDSTNGLINVARGIRYDGGAGVADSLQLIQSGGAVRTSDTYSVGLTNGSGTSTIFGGANAGTQTVFFDNLSPVLDTVSASSLLVNATAADNSITYGAGLVATDGLVTIDEHESIEFSNKGTLTINGGAGQDRIALGSATTPTGLTKIVVDGGTGTADALDVTGTGAAVSVNTSPVASISGALGAVAVQFSNMDSLNLAAGIGDLSITSTSADDTVTVTPGSAGGGGNSGSVNSSGAVPQITFVNSGTFTANMGVGNDSLTVVGTSNPDTIAINEDTSTIQITGRYGINYSGLEQLSVTGTGGSDTFNVTTGSVAVFVDGGDPIGALPGDTLNILANGGSVLFNAGTHTDEGSFVVGINAPVSFDNIESFGISGSGAVVINGTNGPDTITVIARDASTHAGTDGVQDFTVSVNTGSELLFINVADLTINALSGSDQVTLRTPAPNNAAWNVNVTVNGGPPAGDTDRLIVETPGALPETATYTPTSADGGLLTLSASTGQIANITITTTEQLTYDGQGDNDVLKILGTVGDDAIMLTPGANDQSGGVQVSSLLPMSFANLGGSGSVGVDGGLGADTLTYNGTAGNDAFTVNGAGAIGGAGQVGLNTRVIVNTTGVETLTLEGLAGDDFFTLVPSISASVYQTLNFNGGAQASSTGDRVNLIGTVGGDAFAISGQSVFLGGRAVQSSGIEDIRLDALGGTDEITYNALSNVTENITISASSIAGSGQLIVQGVALYDFQGVESFAANGNAGPNGADTLTFTGTTANDLFQIHMAATATTTDPILQLQNSTGTSTLLTLRSYTGFNTLNVLGLEGEDTFNVYVAGTNGQGTAPSRNLFIDGGTPTGKKKSTDNLNLIYTPPRPSIISSAATQNPQSGLIDVNYGAARFLVQYADIEQVVIRRA